MDMPSGMPSDTGEASGDCARADATVTFTAPRVCHALAPNCNRLGEFRVAPIGTPGALLEDGARIQLALVDPPLFRALLGPRKADGNKGSYGHVLVVAGSRGKTGAAAMASMSSLHAGAGLVTVASAGSAIPVIASFAPELMTEFLAELPNGTIAAGALPEIERLMETRTVLAIGPRNRNRHETGTVVSRAVGGCAKPMVVDADALNILAADRLGPLASDPCGC